MADRENGGEGPPLPHHSLSAFQANIDAVYGEVLGSILPSDARVTALGFSQGGEIPNPAPGTDMGRGCGFPLVVMLPRSLHEKKLVSFELFGPKDREEPGYASTPAQPASEELPNNLGCAFFVPERRLTPDTVYRARLVIEGMAEPREWSFTTVDPEKERR